MQKLVEPGTPRELARSGDGNPGDDDDGENGVWHGIIDGL